MGRSHEFPCATCAQSAGAAVPDPDGTLPGRRDAQCASLPFSSADAVRLAACLAACLSTLLVDVGSGNAEKTVQSRWRSQLGLRGFDDGIAVLISRAIVTYLGALGATAHGFSR
jgi:hypothetical protein